MKNLIFNRSDRRKRKAQFSARSLLIFVIFVTSCGIFSARSATVTGTIVKATGTGYAARLSFVPLSNPQVLTNNLLTGEVINLNCAGNGTFTVVLQQGDYRVQIDNRDRFLISVPNDTNTYQLTSLITQSLIFQYKFPYLPSDLNGYTNSITNLLTLSASNGMFSGSLRLPRLTQTQRDAYSPATNGLIILNTSAGQVNFYDGTNWVALGTGTGDVSFTDFSTNYFGIDAGVYPTNLDDSRISATAAIAKSKISTNGTWPVADIPSLPASQITSGTLDTARLGSGTANSTTVLLGNQAYAQIADAQVASGAAIAQSKVANLTSDLATKVDNANGSATNLSLAGANVTTTNLTWNTETLSPSGSTNFVLDFLAPRTALIIATNDVNWLNSTNRTSSTATERTKKVRILASGANRLVTLHSSWLLVGSTTRTLTVTNGTWAVMALDNAGGSETNVFVGLTYAQ